MRGKYCSFIIIGLFIGISLSPALSSSIIENGQALKQGHQGWYYLPSYPNYAPQGLPDFDQRQGNWKCKASIWRLIGGIYSFCGPTSLSDVLWWFDSKHENPSGYPGDGNDTYSLVRDYHAPGAPDPGPYSDDHNFNNVNDLSTPWHRGRGGKEFVEEVAWYCNTNFCQSPLWFLAGTSAENLEKGANAWIQDDVLQDHYHVEAILKPDFATITKAIQHNDGVIVNLYFYNKKIYTPIHLFSHFVGVAGVNPDDGYIALSDPVQNKMNPVPGPKDHNDAGVVSHDIYKVYLTSPKPEIASWGVLDFCSLAGIHFDGLAKFALIISETD